MSKHSSSASRALPAAISAPRLAILLATLALVLLGLVMVYSSSMVKAIIAGDNASSYMVKQIVFAVVGAIIAFAMYRFPTMNLLRNNQVMAVIWGLTMALLALTAVFGTGDESWGAKRWILVPGIGTLQASEFAKITFIVVAASLYSKYIDGEYDGRTCLGSIFLVVLVPMAVFITYLQSDLGSTLIICLGVIAVLWIGNIHGLLIASVFGVIGVFGAIAALSSEYRRDRLLSFMNPWSDSSGDGLQLIHSFYAFAEGGFSGLGLGNSREKFSYLPMAETDFIFSIIGEELGVIGCVVVMVLFLLLLWAGLEVARSAGDAFCSMVAGGIVVMLVGQAFINMGCAVGLLPTTGKPLPFISAGGSSMLASFMMIGLLLAVSEDSGAPTVHEQRRQDLRLVHAVNGSRANDFRVTRGGSHGGGRYGRRG